MIVLWRLAVAQLVLILSGAAALAAVTFFLTPAAISNQYAGTITLAIAGLTSGEKVTVDKFLDANTSGGDLLVQRFQLTDGLTSLIGGKTNINVPGDSNATGGAITTPLNFERTSWEPIGSLAGAWG